ncbi:MAG: integrin alpha [Gammaproteobacteria bacterium]|nr:integrin alpha [Gammaproteobacteria bacterium]
MAGGTLGSPGTKDLPGSFAQGTHKLVWAGTATDGKRVTKTQTLIVRDLTSPALTITSSTPNTPEAISATATNTPLPKSVEDLVTSSDNVTPDSLLTPVRSPAGDLAVGSHTLVWTITDEAGLSSSATQKVVVSDTTAPDITCPPTVRIDRDSSIAKSAVLSHLGSAMAMDAVDASIKTPTNNFAQINGGASTIPKGTSPVQWTAVDKYDNSATCEQDIYVVPTKTEFVVPSEGVASKKFGSALASGGAAIFIGDPEDGTRTENAGSVTAYNTKTGTTIRTLYPEASKHLYFGTALAVFGPANNLLAVGAPGYDGNGVEQGQKNVGAVFVYNVHSGALVQTINNPNTGVVNEEGLPSAKPNRSDHFGASLTAMGDKLVIGAHMYDKLEVEELDTTPTTKQITTTMDVGKVYVFDSTWAKLYEIENPVPEENSRFGHQLAAHDDADSEIIYVSSLTGKPSDDTESIGAVYAFDASAATASTGATRTASIFSDTPTIRTLFGETQLRTGSDGSVYIGEPQLSSASAPTGKIHHYSSTGRDLGAIVAPECCALEFGKKFALDGRLLYAGDTFAQETGSTSATPRPAGTLTAFHPTSHGHLDSFVNAHTSTGASTYHYGLAVELMPDDRVAVTEYFLATGDKTSRVHILDLRTLAPTFTPVESGASGSAAPPPQTTTTTTTPTVMRLIEPTLSSTQHVSPDKVRLTYDVALDPFEVDVDDYVMTDVGLEIVSASVDDRVITLTYAGVPSSGTPNAAPSVELIGTIGYY